MKSELIVMLTNQDVTVPNARELFLECAHLPVAFWGFKDVGLAKPEMVRLVEEFSAAGKTPVLEVVQFEEAKALEAARLARDCGIEYFTGTRYSPAVHAFAQEAGLKYFPFCGEVSGEQIALTGSIEEIVEDAQRVLDAGTDGVDLTAYRSVTADPVALARELVARVGGERVIIAGSINTVEQVQLMDEIGPLGFTMGGALFESRFVPGGSFKENLQFVVDTLHDLRMKVS
ncbi:hypothetical protein [Sinomonas sp. G460-2]|uniref:hypothetical protein n=1 Tax=Sinomonas sp. G460-2 TaxID=3393464 RepID=UPI0039F0DAA4